MEELEAHGEINPYLQTIDQENSTLRKKIMLNENNKNKTINIIQMHPLPSFKCSSILSLCFICGCNHF